MRYSLCNQTVTIYNAVTVSGGTAYRRTVINGVYFDNSRTCSASKTGLTSVNGFTCLIPQGADGKRYVPPIAYRELAAVTDQYTLNAQDRIVLGVCPKEFTVNDTSWASFKVDTMEIVRNADEKYYRGELVHVEVSG